MLHCHWCCGAEPLVPVVEKTKPLVRAVGQPYMNRMYSDIFKVRDRNLCVKARSYMDDVPDREEVVLDWTRAKIDAWCESISDMDRQSSMIHDLLKFCMLLSLEEMAFVSGGSTVEQGYRVQRDTWSLQNIKKISSRVKELFIKRVSEESSVEVLAEKYPTTLVSTINQVLFEDQGYQRMKHFGDLECFQLSKVLDNGRSCPILLAVVYMAVAEESGMPLHALVLEEGSYVVLFPKHGNFSSCVIDPYAQGIIISGEEIAELFEVEMPLQPSSLQDIACAIVQQFLETCWSAALQLPPEPAFRIPITLEVALGEYDDISYSYGGNDEDAFFCLDESSDSCRDYMLRCMSAAEKLLLLSKDLQQSRLQLAILCYFAKDYNRAATLLDQLLTDNEEEDPGNTQIYDSPEEADWSIDRHRMKILHTKCVLCSSFTD